MKISFKSITRLALKLMLVYAGVCVILSNNEKIFDKGYTYKESGQYEYPLAEITNIRLDGENVYCFSWSLHTVNVYSKAGEFLYSIKVPAESENGHGTIYFVGKYLCIKNNYGNVYQYLNGEYVCKLCISDFDDGSSEVSVFNKNDQLSYSQNVDNDFYVLAFTDGKLTFCEEGNEEEYFSTNDSVIDTNDDIYSIAWWGTQLRKNDTVIVKSNIFSILFSSPILAYGFFFIMMAIEIIVENILSDNQ